MSKITDGLYLGDKTDASSKLWLRQHHISHILNATVEVPNYYPRDYNYLKLDVIDSPVQQLYRSFEPSYQFIIAALNSGGTVLVHCAAGVSRSTSIVAYFLMKAEASRGRIRSLEEVLRHIRSKRPIVNPNRGFITQLRSMSGDVLEQSLRTDERDVQSYNRPRRGWQVPSTFSSYNIQPRYSTLTGPGDYGHSR